MILATERVSPSPASQKKKNLSRLQQVQMFPSMTRRDTLDPFTSTQTKRRLALGGTDQHKVGPRRCFGQFFVDCLAGQRDYHHPQTLHT